jgi:hypothetical protein
MRLYNAYSAHILRILRSPELDDSARDTHRRVIILPGTGLEKDISLENKKKSEFVLLYFVYLLLSLCLCSLSTCIH